LEVAPFDRPHVSSYSSSIVTTLCLKKVYPLMFDNNLGKCGPIFKILYQLIRRKILYVHTSKNSTSSAVCCYTTL